MAPRVTHGQSQLPPLSSTFTPGKLWVPPATVAAAPTQGTSQKPVKRPGTTSVSRTCSPSCRCCPLSVLNAQSPWPCPSALLGSMHCLHCTERGTAGWGAASSAPPSQPSPARLSLLPSERGRGGRKGFPPDVPGGAGASGGPASNLHT